MDNLDEYIDIEDIIGDAKAQFIPIDKCVASDTQMRQTGTQVKKDDKLVDQIRKLKGLLHPIIVKKNDDGDFEIIVGQRRTNAYHILRDEDPRYEKIKAYVITRDLKEDEKRVISFIENFGRDEPSKADFINVIEYFYMKYNRNKKLTAEALGISSTAVTKYLTHARLSDRVKKCISDKEFPIDIAMEALKGLGDDEASVNDDELIEVARYLKKLKPIARKKTVKQMKRTQKPIKEIMESTSKITREITIGTTDEQNYRLQTYQEKYNYPTESDAAVEAMDKELLRDQEDE